MRKNCHISFELKFTCVHKKYEKNKKNRHSTPGVQLGTDMVYQDSGSGIDDFNRSEPMLWNKGTSKLISGRDDG